MAKPKPEIPQGRFVLQPCKIREDKVVPSKDEAVALTLCQFVRKFSVTGQRDERIKLRSARVGGYIGVCTGSRSGRPTLFVIWRRDRANAIDFLLRKDRTFPERLHEIYRLDECDWGSRVEERTSGKKDTPTWKARAGAGSSLMEMA